MGIYPAPQLRAHNLDVKEEEVEEMQKRLAYTDLSLETPLHDESDDTIMALMKSDEDVEEIVADRETSTILAKKVKEFKATLNEKENFIFDHRIIAEEPVTLQEIGEKFQISRERVRQIENKVLKKFKARFKVEFTELDL